MNHKVYLTMYFTDGTSIKLAWREEDSDSSAVIAKVRKGLESERFIVEADGNLIVVPIHNLKYFSFSPLPDALPENMVIKGASIVG
jgi:hypothetical protein